MKIKRLLPLTAFLLLPVTALNAEEKIDYSKVNAQALQEYQQPVRPGTNGINPFWNEFAKKFMYAPAFDFPEAKKAKEYLFTVSDKAGKQWTFKASSTKADLSPIWQQIPTGKVVLTVIALNKKGEQTTDTVGKRKFMRDFPFHGPYNPPTRSYKEAALKGMLYNHRLKAIQSWKDHVEPDMSYAHNTYACKIMGATIRNEVLVAKYFPNLKDDALKMACNVATFLKSISQPEGSPLAYFPPTYYKGLIASAKTENQNKTMCMEAAGVGLSLMDLYGATQDKQYRDWACHIADTYMRLQREDGSLPIKLDLLTGEPVNKSNAMLHMLLRFLRRLNAEWGETKYETMRQKAENWMNNVAVKSFDMTGQFEDVSVQNLKPYQNLTNCTAAPYAEYIYSKKNPTKEELQEADDLMRLSEDQFTYWESMPDEYGIHSITTPCVFEQYKYQTPVDNSACNVAGGFLAKYQHSGDQLALAKAIALTNSLTVVQFVQTGQIPTTWGFHKNVESYISYWVNCSLASINMLLSMDEVLAENPQQKNE